MYVKRLKIRNFRSIREASIDLDSHTAILGGNGTGKSSILRAIEKFYSKSSSVDPEDFFNRDLRNPIEIELTFSGLTEPEAEVFSGRVHRGEMSVARVFDASAGKSSGRYFGLSMQCPAFIGVRATPGAREKRGAYDTLRQLPQFSDLPGVSRADDIEQHLAAWEHAHPEQCELHRDDGQFFGFTNVGRGSLQKYTSFVFIPAIRDATSDAVDAKGAVVAQLMEIVVRSAIQRRRDIQEFQAEISTRYEQLVSPDNLPELGGLSDNLTSTLKKFYADSAVNLRWQAGSDFSLPLPAAEVLLDDDGFEGPVSLKGHGLQRAFILTLLQHLAGETLKMGEDEGGREESATPNRSTSGAERHRYSLILAIEEPELYQHPTKQRHFSSVLKRLSDGSLAGEASDTQVIFASHSSLFVSPDRFGEIRLARRKPISDGECKECVVLYSSLENVCRKLEGAFSEPPGSRNVEALKSRLHVVGPELSEGFFAEVAVLVEGSSDRAALIAGAMLDDYDFEANGIAVLPVNGKTGIAAPAIMFQSLDIPTFLIWDCDEGSKDAHVEHNRALQIIAGVAEEDVEDFVGVVALRHACFKSKLEDLLKLEIGPDLFDQCVAEAQDKYGLRRQDAIKSPAAMRHVLMTAAEQGRRSATLREIVAQIAALRTRAP